MPSKDASTVGFDTKTKDNDDDRMDNDDETENLLRCIFGSVGSLETAPVSK